MDEIEQLRRNTEKAYIAALDAMLNLLEAISKERNYWRDICQGK